MFFPTYRLPGLNCNISTNSRIRSIDLNLRDRDNDVVNKLVVQGVLIIEIMFRRIHLSEDDRNDNQDTADQAHGLYGERRHNQALLT